MHTEANQWKENYRTIATPHFRPFESLSTVNCECSYDVREYETRRSMEASLISRDTYNPTT